MCKQKPVPYLNDDEYIKDLREVFEKDYGVTFSEEELSVVERNIEIFLRAFL